MHERCRLTENHTIRNIFLLLCGLFLLMLSLLLYQAFKPRYYHYEPNDYRAVNRKNYVTSKTEIPRRLTVPEEEEEIVANETNAEDQWEQDEVYFGDDILSSTDEGLQRYRIHTSARTWFEAVTTCWNEGGHLAMPEDEEESRLLGRMLKAAVDTGNITNTQLTIAMHVGVNSIVSTTWTTLEGVPVKNIKWLRWQFDRGYRNFYYSCSAVLPNGRVTEHSCSETLIYACDMEQQNRSEEYTYAPITSDGYEAVGRKSRYRIHRSPLPWFEALEVCEKEGGFLMSATMPHQRELVGRWVSDHLPQSESSGGFLLGANDIGKDGSWYDTQGEYFSWYLGSVRRSIREKSCVVLFTNATVDFVSCDEPRPFVCEKRIPEHVREAIEYVQVEGLGRYALHTIPRNWGQAVLQCLFENATLAVPDSPREAEVLADMYRKCTICSRPYVLTTQDYQWMGINDLDNDKIWRKLTGERTNGSGFNEWTNKTLPLSYKALCGALVNGAFVNEFCENHNVFICEKSL